MPVFISYLVIIMLTFLGGGLSAHAQDDAQWHIQLDNSTNNAQSKATLKFYQKKLANVRRFITSANSALIVMGPFENKRIASRTMKQLKRKKIAPQSSKLVRLHPIQPSDLTPDFERPTQENNNSRDLHEAQSEDVNTSEESEQAEEAEETDFNELSLEEQIALRDEVPTSLKLRKKIQTALQWMGYYNGDITGDFNHDTERAIRAYQSASSLPVTGLLSDIDIASLTLTFEDENADLGFELFRSIEAGLEVALPLGQVKFDKISAPFLQFIPREGILNPLQIRVLVFSKTGDRNTLQAFFDIIKQFDFAKEESNRTVTDSDFLLQAHGTDFASYNFAKLKNNQVKGFSLIFPRRYTGLMTRAGRLMQHSFKTVPRFAISMDTGNDIEKPDLLSDITPRPPDIVQSGFYYTSSGSILTDKRINENCQRIVVDEYIEANFFRAIPGRGVVLQPKEQLAPRQWAKFAQNIPWQNEKLVVAGYSLGGVLGAPSLIPSTVIHTPAAGAKIIDHSGSYLQLKTNTVKNDIGGPVFNDAGLVVGFLTTAQDDTQEHTLSLPEGHAYVSLISSSNVSKDTKPLSHQKLENLAKDITVSIACWLN